jgi:hypothetical protein
MVRILLPVHVLERTGNPETANLLIKLGLPRAHLMAEIWLMSFTHNISILNHLPYFQYFLLFRMHSADDERLRAPGSVILNRPQPMG